MPRQPADPFKKLFSALTQAFVALWELRDRCFERHQSPHEHCVTHQDLSESEQRIMSAVSAFAEQQAAFNARIEAAITGVAGDVTALNALIEQLQNSVGTITPEDQALLDALQTQGAALAARLEALDALTPAGN